MPRVKALLPLACLLPLLSACRQDKITVDREPKEALPAMPPIRAPSQGLRWTTPPGWKELPAGGMRAVTFIPPPAAGKAQAAVVVFPGDVGGELANVNRWRGQLGLAPVAEGALAGLRRVVRSPAGELSVYDMSGPGAKPSRMVAGMIEIGGETWFFKLSGESAAVGKDKAAFMDMLGGLRADAR